ncbi:MAG TPA: ATP-binding protein [Pyrinomonadaceae bacterium]|nr:ATP-binding protein [Pyrinomonadaceae bacterium]
MVKVLVVDDEPSIRLTVAEFLRRAGYETVAAADFASASGLTDGVDVAVVDVNLPDGSGVELLDRLNRREPYVPVIMITGDPQLPRISEIIRAGAYDFIVKPIYKDVLIKAVSRAAEKKQLEDEKRQLEEEVRRHAEELERRVEERTAELVEVYRVLAQQEKIAALGRVAAQVAHEVKNPLAGLLLYALHLKGKVEGKLADSETSLLDKIVVTINHLTSTCEQILSFARPVHLAPRRTDLNRVLTDVLQLLEPQLAAAGVRVSADLDPAGARGRLDESSLRSVLMNLALNAVQAMPQGGELRVRTRAGGGTLVAEVGDTGTGMTEEQVKSIFEPFYTTKSAGLGLGLPYAKKVVEEHRGQIAVESRPGEGTTIRIALPAGAEE